MGKVFNEGQIDDPFRGVQEDDEPAAIRRIYIRELGAIIPPHLIVTVTKIVEFVESNLSTGGGTFRSGIAINESMEPTQNNMFVDKKWFYNTFEEREEAFERLMETLEENGYKIIPL